MNQSTPSRSKTIESTFIKRQQKLKRSIDNANINAIILNPGHSLKYLTNLSFHLSERPMLGIFTPDNPVVLVVPELEAAKTKELPFDAQTYTYSEEPSTWLDVFKEGINSVLNIANTEDISIGIEPRALRFLEMEILQNAAPRIKLISGEAHLSSLRMIKDDKEQMYMRRAAQIAQTALIKVVPSIKPGVTEREIANALTLQLLKEGSDPNFPFQPIVSGGPNSANPHASPTDRPLCEGDLLVIDWGASHNGYISDITRTFAIGDVDPELSQVHEIVQQANSAGRRAALSGSTASDIDEITREVIDGAGYGQYFTHRTGHGIGMEGHEPPYIRSGNSKPITPGMTFTIEPGIYLPNRGGVRIEDDMLMTEKGAESMTDLPRNLQRLK